jgi:hypothetical protein
MVSVMLDGIQRLEPASGGSERLSEGVRSGPHQSGTTWLDYYR